MATLNTNPTVTTQTSYELRESFTSRDPRRERPSDMLNLYATTLHVRHTMANNVQTSETDVVTRHCRKHTCPRYMATRLCEMREKNYDNVGVVFDWFMRCLLYRRAGAGAASSVCMVGSEQCYELFVVYGSVRYFCLCLNFTCGFIIIKVQIVLVVLCH